MININKLLGVRANDYLAIFPALLRKLSDGPHLKGLLSRKAFVERASWLVVMYSFQRIVLLNLIAIHVMLVMQFTRASCEDDAKLQVPDPFLRIERNEAIDSCLLEAHGSHGFKMVSTVTLSHAGYQIVLFALSIWVEPRRPIWGWSLLWNVLSFVLPCLLISHYAIERQRTNYYSGLSDSFLWAALVYTGLWTPVLLQIPMKLPGYNHCWGGVAPQWVMRPHLSAGLQTIMFSVIVLSMKWLFEYYAFIKGLYHPSRAIWEGDYHCWELGHTGLIGCSWDQSSPEFIRDIRDWTVRLMLLGIRWSMPVMIFLADTVMFYVLTLSLFSAWIGRRQRIGHIRSWSQLVVNFMQTQLLYTQKIMSYPRSVRAKIRRDRISRGGDAVSGFDWSYEGTSREWRDFGTAWNAIVESLRKRDLLSNSERDELRFMRLDKPEHTVFFSVPQYFVLPAMLSAPVFAASRGKSLLTPSATSYAPFQPTVVQLRDLNTYLLVAMGLVKLDDRKKFRALLSNLMKDAYSIFNLRKQERNKMYVLIAKWEQFIRCCYTASRNSGSADEELRLALDVRSGYQSMLKELTDLLADEKSSLSHRVDPQTLDELFDVLRQGNVDFRRRSFSYVRVPSSPPEGSRLASSPPPGSPESIAAESNQHPSTYHDKPVGKSRLMFGFLELLKQGQEELTLSDAHSMMEQLREQATQSVLEVLSQYTTTVNPGAEPKSEEAKRQLISFCSSLYNKELLTSPPIIQMKSFSAFTPFFKEEVLYSVQKLQEAGQDNTTLLTIFKALHPEEWTNFCERVELLEGDVKSEGIERSNGETIGRSLESSNKAKLKVLEQSAPKGESVHAGKHQVVKPKSYTGRASWASSRLSRGPAEQVLASIDA
ncbi:MAG: hypothetical protein SGPRY_000949 [Prymnesium sp.]